MNENNPKIHRPTKQILSTDKNDLPDRQKRICRTTKYNSWTDIDEASGGLVTSMTYIVLFVNDQVYNAALELKDAIRKTPYWRHEPKKHANELEKYMKHYNTYVTSHLKVNVEALAVITQSMEDDVKPHIDIYRMAISQALLGAGVTGDLNHVIAMASTIDMLCQMSKITIRDFQDAVLRIAPITCNPLRWLSVDKAMHLARQLTGTLTPKDAYVNLNEIPMVETAFQAIANKLLSPEVFEKAFNEAETIN